MPTVTEHPAETITSFAETATPDTQAEAEPVKVLIQGVVFGLIFGFILQKDGVAKFHVLIGQLLLVDFTVLKVMISAVVVGALGIHSMHQAGLVKLRIKPTRYASNIIGELLFGIGFALSAYCPGTGAVALGQGNYDAIAMMSGMAGGSYLFAASSGWISKHIDPIGDKGKQTLHDILPMGPTAVVFVVVAAICGLLLAVEMFAVR